MSDFPDNYGYSPESKRPLTETPEQMAQRLARLFGGSTLRHSVSFEHPLPFPPETPTANEEDPDSSVE